MKDSNNYVNMENARTDAQQKVMEEIRTKGECPFCEEHLSKYHIRPVIKQTKWWSFTENGYPYEGAKHHFLFIYRPHGESLNDIPPRSWGGFIHIISLGRKGISDRKWRVCAAVWRRAL